MATRKTTTRTKKQVATDEAVVEAAVKETPQQAADEPEVVVVSEDAVPLVGTDRMVILYLEGQRYALPIERVQEIQQIVAFTDVPDASGIVLGMVNLRGAVVPLIDMRALVGLPAQPFHLETPMIICRLRGALVALVVDEVEDVALMPDGCLQKPSKLHALAAKLLGVCRMDDGLVFLLDLEKLIPEEGLSELEPTVWGQDA